jgi:hypothetical protein
MQADPGMPTSEQLAAVGYDAAMLNQYATEVEDQFLSLADRHQVLAQKYNANSTILTDPNILANYAVDFHRHVDPTFMSRVADYFDQAIAMEQQNVPQDQAQYEQAQMQQLGTPGGGPQQLGSGMLTPEMLNQNEMIIPSQFNRLTQPMLQGTSQQYAMQQAQPQGPPPQMNAGQRVSAPGMPQQGQQMTSDQIYSGIRQQFNQNPAMAWQTIRAIEGQYGPGAIAKPLVNV